jgi:hypothetical protein
MPIPDLNINATQGSGNSGWFCSMALHYKQMSIDPGILGQIDIDLARR